MTDELKSLGAEDIISFKPDILITEIDYRLEPVLGLCSKVFNQQECPSGELISINTKSNKLQKVLIENFPKDILFKPHGLYFMVINRKASLKQTNGWEREIQKKNLTTLHHHQSDEIALFVLYLTIKTKRCRIYFNPTDIYICSIYTSYFVSILQEEKNKLYVLNHAQNKGGERLEEFLLSLNEHTQ